MTQKPDYAAAEEDLKQAEAFWDTEQNAILKETSCEAIRSALRTAQAVQEVDVDGLAEAIDYFDEPYTSKRIEFNKKHGADPYEILVTAARALLRIKESG